MTGRPPAKRKTARQSLRRISGKLGIRFRNTAEAKPEDAEPANRRD